MSYLTAAEVQRLERVLRLSRLRGVDCGLSRLSQAIKSTSVKKEPMTAKARKFWWAAISSGVIGGILIDSLATVLRTASQGAI